MQSRSNQTFIRPFHFINQIYKLSVSHTLKIIIDFLLKIESPYSKYEKGLIILKYSMQYGKKYRLPYLINLFKKTKKFKIVFFLLVMSMISPIDGSGLC